MISSVLSSLPSLIFSPALDLLPNCIHQRHCPELSDANWLRVGVQRCLAPQTSGRGFYARNLRSGTLSHLTVNDQDAREKEHDMRGLKRQTIDTLRQGAKKKRKVPYVWDCPSLRSRPAKLASLGICAMAQAVRRNRLSSVAQVEAGGRYLHAITQQNEYGARQVR
jgi:hypothetical protein